VDVGLLSGGEIKWTRRDVPGTSEIVAAIRENEMGGVAGFSWLHFRICFSNTLTLSYSLLEVDASNVTTFPFTHALSIFLH